MPSGLACGGGFNEGLAGGVNEKIIGLQNFGPMRTKLWTSSAPQRADGYSDIRVFGRMGIRLK